MAGTTLAGTIAITDSWAAKGRLFLIALPFAAGSFHAPPSSGNRQTAIWIVLAVVLAAGIIAAVLALVPRLRRLTSSRIRPHLAKHLVQRQNDRHRTTQDHLHRSGSVLAQPRLDAPPRIRVTNHPKCAGCD